MKKLLLFFLLFSETAISQHIDFKHSINLHSGVFFEDGFFLGSGPPNLGLGYSYRFNKNLSLETRVTSIYKSWSDQPFKPPFNIVHRENANEFIFEQDRLNVTNSGIADLNPKGTADFLFVPITLSLNTSVLRFRKNVLGIGLGISAIYGSYKASRDYLEIDIIFKDGSEEKLVPFAQEIEFRNFILGDSYFTLFYEYQFAKSSVRLGLNSYNVFWAHFNTNVFHLLNLEYNYSF